MVEQPDNELTATSYLGQNTVSILRGLTEYLHTDTDFDISFDEPNGRPSAAASETLKDSDLLWMCGSLTAVLLAGGQLDGRIVAAPIFAGHRAAVYHSVIIARKNGPRSLEESIDSTVGINEVESWSGHHGLRAHVSGLDSPMATTWFRGTMMTGSHHNSVVAVGQGRCDVAAIDVTIWEHLARTEPELCNGLQVIDRTGDWPAPPFTIMARAKGAANAIEEALLNMPQNRVAGLDGIVAADADAYASMLVSQRS